MTFKINYLILLFFLTASWLNGPLTLLISGLIVATLFFLMNQHLALGLIQLEILTMGSSLGVIVLSSVSGVSLLFLMVLFSVGVIEAALGLSLLAVSSRSQSLELFKLAL